MKKLTPVLAAILFLTTAGSYAQNETKSFSASVKGKTNHTVLPSGESTYVNNYTMTYKHTFAITPEQESLLNEDATISIDFDDYLSNFKLSNDPNWQPGNTSAKVDNNFEDPFGITNINAKLKWGKGQFSISAKVNYIGNGLASIAKSPRAPGHPNSTTHFTTQALGTSWNFGDTHYTSFDMKYQSSDTTKSDGTKVYSESGSTKSKSLVDAPLEDDPI